MTEAEESYRSTAAQLSVAAGGDDCESSGVEKE